jgi:outer membrane murein-binding lipoprotein Lpp
MRSIAAAVLAALALAGCASPDYAAYAQAHTARATLDAKRLDSIAAIARESNDPTARIAAIITLSNAESKAHDKIEKPTNVIVEAVTAGAGVYSTWAQTLLGVLNLRRSTSAISENDAANALNILRPATK